MIEDFTRQAIATSLKKMFSQGYFDICTIDNCLKLAKITPPCGQYEALRVLHCVHYNDMDSEFREQLFNRVMALFSDGTTFNLAAIDQGLGLSPMDKVAISATPGQKRRAIGLIPNWRRS